jgi:hypothetical protein
MMGLGLMDQGDLYTLGYNKNSSGRWGSFNDPCGGPGGVDPGGLVYIFDHYYHNSLPSDRFRVVENTDPEALTRQIILNMVRTKLPVAVLVKQASHWVVARGTHLDGDISSDGDFTLLGVTINDPWPSCPYNVPAQYTRAPPHGDNDACGKAGDTQRSCDEFIAWEEWKNEWLCPVAFTQSSIPSTVAVYKTARLVKPGNILRTKHMHVPEVGHFIDEESLTRVTLDEVRLHGLHEHKSYAKALENASPSRPILVQCLDKLDSYYYIVPMVREKMITSTALVDAASGRLMGFTRFNKPVERLFMDHEAMMKKLMEKPIYMEDSHAKFKLREGAYSIHPTMVWKLCRESLSKYYPFHMVTIGNTQVYVGWDGTVHTRLHDPGRFG